MCAYPATKTEEEIKLEKSGDINALQRYQFDRFQKCADRTGPRPFVAFLATEYNLRQFVQGEMVIREMIDRESGYSTAGNLLRCETLQIKLDGLSREYWLLEREWWL